MKKRIITLSQLKEINPYKYGKIITALNRNRVQPKKHKTQNFSVDFSKNYKKYYRIHQRVAHAIGVPQEASQ